MSEENNKIHDTLSEVSDIDGDYLIFDIPGNTYEVNNSHFTEEELLKINNHIKKIKRTDTYGHLRYNRYT